VTVLKAPWRLMIPASPKPLPPAPSNAPISGGTAENPDLLARPRTGDNQAFEELVRGSGSMLLAVARRFLRREEDAQYEVQDAFVTALRSLDRFDAGLKSLAGFTGSPSIAA